MTADFPMMSDPELNARITAQRDTPSDTRRGGQLHDCESAKLPELTIEELRECRKALTSREAQMSYWRRIIQARLDLVRDSAIHGVATVEGLERVLTRHLGGNQRLGILSVQPQGAAPIAGLDHLWNRSIRAGDLGSSELEADLVAAERELSALRADLHRQIDAATTEMIRRYRANPQLAFTALPRRDSRPAPF
jgi:hypothetical protein